MRRWAAWVCTAILSGTFLYAGAVKIAHPRLFQDSILDYQLVGLLPAALLAWWLPWFEVVCAAAVWWPRFRRAGLIALGGMLALFLVVLIVSLVRGLSVDCGCFGTASHSLWVALGIDLALAGLCVGAWRFQRAGPGHPA